MRKIYNLFVIAFLTVFVTNANAQCTYTLEMNDSFGDGWNGNTIDVIVNGTPVLDDVTLATGSTGTLTFTVNDGDDITTLWNGGGGFGYETSYNILDVGSAVVGSGAESSISTPITAVCPTCPNPSAISLTNPTQTTIDVAWTAGSSETEWNVQWGTPGFDPNLGQGTTAIVNPNPTYQITGLTGQTSYEVYVQAACVPGTDTSDWVGPFTFYTAGTCGIYEVSLYDTFGDGWNGGSVDVYINGVLFQSGLTVATGNGPEVYQIPVNDNDIISLDYTAGSFSTENEITVFDQTGTTVATEGLSANTPNDIGDFNVPSGLVACPTCPGPTGLTVDNLGHDTVQISWTAGGAETEWHIEYGPAGFTAGAGSGTTVPNITNNPYTITGLTPETAYDIYIRSVCGPGDTSLVYVGPLSIVTTLQPLNCTTGASYTIYSQDFEGGFPADWTSSEGDWLQNTGQTGSTGTGPSGAHNGTGYVYFEATNPATGEQDTLWSPSFDLSTASNARFYFYYHMFGVNMGTLYVDVSDDGGNTWTNEFTQSGQVQGALADPWIAQSVDLSTYLGSTDVMVRFIAEKGPSFESDVSIDFFNVEACLTCPAPSNINVSNITTTGVDIDWTAGGTETSWNIEYGPAGYTPGTGTSINTSNNPETLTGLIDNTEYDVYVQADCGGGDLSTWSGPANFTTDIVCPAPVALQLLGGTSGTQAELGWNITGTETDWIIEYGPTGFTPGTGAGTSVNTNTNPSTVTGLMPGVVYDFYVQADCGGGQNNPWEGPVTYSVPISNDAACDAIQVPVDGSTTTYINDGATLQTGEPTALGDNTVWFMFDAPASGHVEINTCGEDFDNFIKVYETTDCSDFNTFVGIDSATNNPFMSCTGVDPAGLNLCGLTAGNTYYLAVGSETPATTGAFPLTLTEIPNITAGTGTTSQVCAGDTVTLANALSGADAGGTWSELDMSGGLLPGGLFNSNNIVYGNYRVEYKVENACDADSANVTVSIAGPSQAGQDGTLADCNVLTDFYLYDGLSGTLDFGGTWVDVDATGKLNGSVFSPDSLAAGTYQFDYITTNGVCPADTSTVEVTIQDCLGTEDFTAESFKIFPNPTQGIFYIVSSVNAQDAVVEIMDLQGKVISSQQMNINAGAQFDFDLSQLERGVYLIKVATQENNTVKRVVLQR